MKRQRVSSSNLASIGYDEEQKILEVEFLNNSIYQYFGIPSRTYKNLMDAPSHGKYFNVNIRNGSFPYQKIG